MEIPTHLPSIANNATSVPKGLEVKYTIERRDWLSYIFASYLQYVAKDIVRKLRVCQERGA